MKSSIHNLKSLLSMSVVAMEGSAFDTYSRIVCDNLRNHISLDSLDFQSACSHSLIRLHKDGTSEEFDLAEDGMPVVCSSDGETIGASQAVEDDRHILHFRLTGPVTRSGGFCSYGSMEIRDLLIKYSTDDSCVGFIMETDTPGGDAYALYDMEQGMKAWNEAGKRSIQFIDGFSYSAGVAMGCQCQKVVAMNRHCGVGCIGAMYANVLRAHGTEDKYDSSRFVYVVAKQTPDKNLEFRKAAEGDDSLLSSFVNKFAQDFLDIVSTCRPQVPDEMKTGKTYNAGDCIGTLIDGIGDFGCAVEYALNGKETWETSANADPTPAVPTEDPEEDPEEDPNNSDPACDPEEDPASSADGGEQSQSTSQPASTSATAPGASATCSSPSSSLDAQSSSLNEEDPSLPLTEGSTAVSQTKNINMKYNYICTALGLQEADLHVDEQNDGIFLNAQLVDTLNEVLEKHEADAKAHEEALEGLRKANEEAIANLNKAHEEQVATLEANATAQNSTIESLRATVEENTASINTITEERDNLSAQVESLQAEVKELSEKPAPANLPKNPGTPAASQAEEKKDFTELSLEEMAHAWGK